MVVRPIGRNSRTRERVGLTLRVFHVRNYLAPRAQVRIILTRRVYDVRARMEGWWVATAEHSELYPTRRAV